MESKEAKLVLNSSLSLVQQIIGIICGLILSRMILTAFSSAVNGTMASISQFISFITLLQGGVGTVARFSFYRPLAEKNRHEISIAYKTTSDFFVKFTFIYAIYLIGMAYLYPTLIKTQFSYWYVFSLILVMGLTSVFEYLLGQASYWLLYSDQKNYIYAITRTVYILISTILSIWLISLNCSIQIVKLTCALLYMICPAILYYIVHKQYHIDNAVKPDKKLFAQRNAALVRHIAYYIHTSTDIIVITIFSGVLWVSVYTVHQNIVNNLTVLISMLLGNIEVLLGNMLAKGEKRKVQSSVCTYDLLVKLLCGGCFYTCIIVMPHFISIYTNDITDINYQQPVFVFLLCVSEMVGCMGLIYQSVYIAAGHIHKTEWISVTEAVINLTLSILLVKRWGITGVVFGTLMAMVFKTLANIYYMQKHVLKLSVVFIVKSYIANIFPGSVMIYICKNILCIYIANYIQFFIYAMIVFLSVFVAIYISDWILLHKEVKHIIQIIKCKILKKHSN